MAPTNYPATNPEVLQRALETDGASLLQGFANLVGDARKGRITMSDDRAFAVGRNLAVTPGSVVFRNELIELTQLQGLGPKRVRLLFDAHRHKTIATLRADGSPRISGIEAHPAPELGVDLRESITICDLGDVFTIPGNIEKTFDQISKAVTWAVYGSFMIVFMYLMPTGVAGFLRLVVQRLRKSAG